MGENLRPPLPNYQWRQDASSTKGPSQRGIDPSSFHHGSNKHSRQPLKQALKEASTSVVRQKRREVTAHLKLQRAAYKEVTTLKTWPLQELAMKDFAHIMSLHLGLGKDDDDGVVEEKVGADVAEAHGDSTGLSSSSLEEPKRTRRRGGVGENEEDLSPRKSTLRHFFQLDFLRERSLGKGAASVDQFQTALWCMEPRIFSVEKSTTGKRKYMVGHLGRFLDYYWRKIDPKHRHYYELIREKTPCRLYFDLEFSKAANPEITNDLSCELLKEFIVELALEFQRHYELQVDRSCIVDLDSSTDTKFSRHFIVHLPNQALFEDAAAAGRFVRVFVGRLAEQTATGQLSKSRPALAKYLFVNSSAPLKKQSLQDSQLSSQSDKETDVPVSKTCFVDMGVYTRNRLFRLLGSSKFGKPASAALRIADSNEFPFPKGFNNDSFYVPDMEKRVKEVRSGEVEEFDMVAEINKFLSAVDWTDHATALGETLVVPVNSSKLDVSILKESDEARALLVESSIGDKEATGSAVSSSRPTGTMQVGVSPFPCVDEFVRDDLGCRGGVQGAIRAWSVETDTNGLAQFVTYQMSRNRWCERLKRPHRSNNIMWTVDLQTMQCTQTCHDPECRSQRFRSTPVDLPTDIRETVSDALFEQQLATMDEKDLLEKKKNVITNADLDDDEFEMALLALNINGDDDDDREPSQPQTDELEALSDDVLLDAMLSNPDLFP